MTSTDHAPTPLSQTAGAVHGGQQPVIGAAIQLIAPGTSGYGSAGTVLASTTTDGTGSFTLPAYTCPQGNVQTYILATGGNPGAGPNPNLVEAALLGPCSGLAAIPFVSISEVTTVAAAYTLAPFAGLSAGVTNIGTTSTNLIGLQNATNAANLLANFTNGQANVSNAISGVLLPQSMMNTIADILAACVNTSISPNAGNTCSTLFTNATPPGGTAPTDTFQAAIDIALNPGNNETNMYYLIKPAPPYQPFLQNDPFDLALGIQYNGSFFIHTSEGPQGMDIDAQGNAWTAAYVGTGSAKYTGLVEITPNTGTIYPTNGTPFFAGLFNPVEVAINSAGLVNIADYNGWIYQYNPSTNTQVKIEPFVGQSTTPLMSGAGGLAIDNRDSSMWVADWVGNTLTHLTSSGSVITASSGLPTGSAPLGLAIDGSGNILTVDSDTYFGPDGGANSGLTEYIPNGDGTYSGGNVLTNPTGQEPADIAFDHAGNAWVTPQEQGVGIGEYTNGVAISPAGGFISNTNNVTDSIAVDGLGRIFVSNNNFFDQTLPGTLTVFSGNGTLISTANGGLGYYAGRSIPGDPFLPGGLALDASGNCWIAGNTPSAVTEIIGIAAPVSTPLSSRNAPTNRIGVRP